MMDHPTEIATSSSRQRAGAIADAPSAWGPERPLVLAERAGRYGTAALACARAGRSAPHSDSPAVGPSWNRKLRYEFCS